MRTIQQGDRVQVHYTIHSEDGSVRSSRDRVPLDLTVGTRHPRLPGLGLVLVGLAPGMSTTLTVPAELGFGMRDPSRIYRLSRTQFLHSGALRIGKWVRIRDRRGRDRRVRIVDVNSRVVVVDTNHRWAGQTLALEVEVVSIEAPVAPKDEMQ